MPGWSSSCGTSFRGELFDLAGELSFLGGELLDASRDGFEGEVCAAQLGVLSAVWSGRRSGVPADELG